MFINITIFFKHLDGLKPGIHLKSDAKKTLIHDKKKIQN